MVRDMPTFLAPQYSKVAHPTTGVVEPCYTFTVGSTESTDMLSCTVEEAAELEVILWLQRSSTWWDEWLATFLSASATFFSKPYTVQHLHKITKHTLTGTLPALFPAQVTAHPQTIQIRGGIFWVHWVYVATAMPIDIPDMIDDTEEKTLPDSDEVEELTGAEVPEDPNATELVLDTPTKCYDKHKVKEARLKAKIALYRAQQQINRYYEKYGTEVSESESESEESDEEVQL